MCGQPFLYSPWKRPSCQSTPALSSAHILVQSEVKASVGMHRVRRTTLLAALASWRIRSLACSPLMRAPAGNLGSIN